jgi:hypothetical protein
MRRFSDLHQFGTDFSLANADQDDCSGFCYEYAIIGARQPRRPEGPLCDWRGNPEAVDAAAPVSRPGLLVSVGTVRAANLNELG